MLGSKCLPKIPLRQLRPQTVVRQCPIFASVPKEPVATGSPAAPPSQVAQEVFRCKGLEDEALMLRRGVQVGMTLEFGGTQASNLLFHDGLEVISAISDMSNLLVMLHIWLVVRYAAVMRDALLARHVTRIAVLAPESAESGQQAEPVLLLVETGPWARRIKLRSDPPTEDEVAPFGQLLQLGALHVDQQRGEVLSSEVLQRLQRRDLHVHKEEIFIDSAAAQRTFMAEAATPPSLHGIPTEGLSWLEESSRMQQMLQWPGGIALKLFGGLCCLMGSGTVILWSPQTGPLLHGRHANYIPGYWAARRLGMDE